MTFPIHHCIHCGNHIPSQWSHTEFCCAGCRYVHRLIQDFHLEKYYELKPEKSNPLSNIFSLKQNFGWIETSEEVKHGSVRLHIEGIQCAACVWLIQEVIHRFGKAHASINTTLGMLKIEFDPGTFQLMEYLKLIQEFGYKTSLWNSKTGEKIKHDDNLLIRLVLCAAIALNSMMFSFSFYMGLAPNEKNVYTVFGLINFILTTGSFLIGGSYFISKTYQGLKNKILHFDLPISLGIILVYFGSTYLYFKFGSEKTFFDTLNVFITLMLLGRFLQNRMIERNKNKILREKTISGLKIIRKTETIDEIPLSALKIDDLILVSSGSIVPVDGILVSSKDVELDLSWMSGEADPKIFSPGSGLPSGSKVVSQDNIEMKVQKEFEFSSLALLFADSEKNDSLPLFWQYFSKYYVLAVLLLAGGGFFAHYLHGGLQKALEVAVSVSVVTCPCALGIAIPLARSLTNKELVSLGVFVRHSYFLEKLSSIRKIIFDKTGTLTLSNLSLANPEKLRSLSFKDTQVLFNLVARSQHPASQAIFQYLLGGNIPKLDLQATEKPGVGMFCNIDGDQYFLGRSKKISNESLYNYEVVFLKNELQIGQFFLRETLQDHAKQMIDWFTSRKLQIYQLSGDKNERVVEMAKQIGIEEKNSYGNCTPEMKAELVEKIDREDTLYLGDGLNDTLAFQKSFLSGVALGNHVNMAQNCNFFFISTGLGWIRKIFEISKKLQSTIHFLLGFVIFYNFFVIFCAMMGWIGPLACAIIMPLSSLFVISVTTKKMNRVA